MELETIKQSIHEMRGKECNARHGSCKTIRGRNAHLDSARCPVSESSGVERHGKSKSIT